MASLPRVIAFFNGQNLHHSSNSTFPNASDDYNLKALATLIAKRQCKSYILMSLAVATKKESDVRIALDLIRLTLNQQMGVSLVL